MTDDIMLMGKNPNYLGSWDLYDISGNEINVSIKDIKDEQVITNGQKEVCTVCYFNENVKPMILNLTNKKTLSKLHHTKKISQLRGKYITIGYEKIKAFGKMYDALRIKNTVPELEAKGPKFICSECNDVIKAAKGMNAEQMVEYTRQAYGIPLCKKCAAKRFREINEKAEL